MLLTIDNHNIHVSYKKNAILLSQAAQDTQRIPLRTLKQVIIYRCQQLDLSVLRALANHHIPTTLLPARTRNPPAILASGLATQLPLRQWQYHCANNKNSSVAIAKWIIERKIESYVLPLHFIDAQHQPLKIAFSNRCHTAQHAITNANDINSLLGIEGQVAHAWFQLLSTVIDTKWRFTGRNRRPPRDPVNALLSLYSVGLRCANPTY